MYYIVQYTNRFRVPIDWMIWLSAGLAITAVVEKLSPALSPPGEDQVSGARLGSFGGVLASQEMGGRRGQLRAR
jgi:hypothetical protein